MFGKRFTLFRLFGFDVRIDVSWLFIAVLVTWSLATGLFPYYYPDLSTSMYWLMGAIGAIGLFASIIIHEFAHSLVARQFGQPMKGITLFIFGGVAEMEDEPPSPKAELLMALAGPATSLVIGGVAVGAVAAGWTDNLPVVARGIIGYIGFINVVVAAFNLLPAYPLDGGRALRAVLWNWKNHLNWATRIASSIGSGFGILLIVLGVFTILTGNFIGGMWWVLIGFFIRGAAQASYQQLLMKKGLEGETVSSFMQPQPVTVTSNLPIDKLVHDYFYRFHHRMFPVVDDGELKGFVRSTDLREIDRTQWGERHVSDVMHPIDSSTISAETDARQALAKMNQKDNTRLMVTDNSGHLTGIVTLRDLMQFLNYKLDLEIDEDKMAKRQ